MLTRREFLTAGLLGGVNMFVPRVARAQSLQDWPMIVIVSSDGSASSAELRYMAAALQYQLSAHVYPYWGVTAYVYAGGDPNAIPDNAWPMDIINPDSPLLQGAAGMHDYNNGSERPFEQDKPYMRCGKFNYWTEVASHEGIELVVNPLHPTTKFIKAPAIYAPTQGTVAYLVQVCDPVVTQTYRVFHKKSRPNSGVSVQNFCTPGWYLLDGSQADFLGKVTPLGMANGGYCNWVYNCQTWEADHNYSKNQPYAVYPIGGKPCPPQPASDPGNAMPNTLTPRYIGAENADGGNMGSTMGFSSDDVEK